MRLDQRIAKFSQYSRSEVKKHLHNGKVKVDGVIVRHPATQVSYEQVIELYGEVLAGQQSTYIMLHKPAGVVSARKDAQHPTALALVNVPNQHDLVIAGRLDIDTTGLLLLSDDGDWVHRMMSPKHKQAKCYRVQLDSAMTTTQVEGLEAGVMLRGDDSPTMPADVHVVNEHCILMTIYEGRYHQVKRMLAAVGNHVCALHRERVGSIRLDPQLMAGEWRQLRPDEIVISA